MTYERPIGIIWQLSYLFRATSRQYWLWIGPVKCPVKAPSRLGAGTDAGGMDRSRLFNIPTKQTVGECKCTQVARPYQAGSQAGENTRPLSPGGAHVTGICILATVRRPFCWSLLRCPDMSELFTGMSPFNDIRYENWRKTRKEGMTHHGPTSCDSNTSERHDLFCTEFVKRVA